MNSANPFALFTCIMTMAALCAAQPKAQAPNVPPEQAKFCTVLANWKFRGGFAPGSEPTIDPNPIRAARTTVPDPGNMFDQLVEAIGADGTINGWKCHILRFGVTNDHTPAVSVKLSPYCVEFQTNGSRREPIEFATEDSLGPALKSPIADFLASDNVKASGSTLYTFSGRLRFNPKTRFFAGKHATNPRDGCNPCMGTGPANYYLQSLRTWWIELTDISK